MSSTTTSPGASRGSRHNRSGQHRTSSPTANQGQNQGRNQNRNAARPPRPQTPDDGDVVTATLRGTVSLNPRGFGFVTAVDPERPDVFIPPPLLKYAACIDADLVDVTYTVAGDKTTAQSITLVHRSRTRVFGIVVDGFLQPDPFVAASPIHLIAPYPRERVGALVELLEGGNARVLAEFGHPASPSAVYARALERSRVAEVADRYPHAPRSPELAPAKPRVDLTSLLTFTIDGPESRDLDDALSVERLADGSVRLYVHIADVASAVPTGSAMDVRARALATSVYLPGFSIPMIDPALSYDACSLLEDQVRSTLTIAMDIDAAGNVVETELFESVIRSNARLTYVQVADFLAGATTRIAPGVAVALTLTHDVTQRLGTQRARRGGLGSAEAEHQSDLCVAEGQIAIVGPDGADVAHHLIEEAMVAANESVAQWLIARDLPGVFRTHAGPGDGASAALVAFVATLGLEITLPDVLTPRDLSDLEDFLASHGHEDVEVFNVLADHLARAAYTPVVGDHFGLASVGYVHFTSPIRRYADLTVHRIIKAHLAGTTYDDATLAELCGEINAGASRASRAESVARALFFAILVQRNKRDTVYPASVSRVSKRGVFVRLDAMSASGWIAARDIAESPVRVDENAITLTAGRDVFTLGQAINVRVHRTDLEAGAIEFIQASKPQAPRNQSSRGSRPARSGARR